MEDLPSPVFGCLNVRDQCGAYEMDPTVTKTKRYGNLFLDMFAFKRKTLETGWNFRALNVIEHDLVVYKLWSGEPNLENYETKRKPLGPFQELEGVVRMPTY